MNEFSAEQVKAARMLLAWDQATLAKAAAVGIATVKRIEASTGALQSTPRIAAKIKIALETAGINSGACNSKPSNCEFTTRKRSFFGDRLLPRAVRRATMY